MLPLVLLSAAGGLAGYSSSGSGLRGNRQHPRSVADSLCIVR